MVRPRRDPELGVVASAKKDDDLYMKGGKTLKSSTGWKSKPSARFPPRKTLKRLAVLLLVVAAVYVFIHNIPTDIGPRDRRRPVYVQPTGQAPLQPGLKTPFSDRETEQQPPVLHANGEYDGPLRFLELAESLHGISGTKGTQQINKNVLFMAASLKSADILLPIACQMGKELRSYVNFALLSRNDIPLQQLRDINGIDDSCNIIFHGTIIQISYELREVSEVAPSPSPAANKSQMRVRTWQAAPPMTGSCKLQDERFTTLIIICIRKLSSWTDPTQRNALSWQR